MEQEQLRHVLEDFKTGVLSADQVIEQLKFLPYESVNGYANLDHHRQLRTGFPEVIFAERKTPDQVAEIFLRLQARSAQVLATRVSAEMYAQVRERLPGAVYHPTARLLYYDGQPDRTRQPGVLVLTAGTADLPIAEEAALTAELMGQQVERVFDVGISGLHRLIDRLPLIQKARVIVVVAGMEGALPSVVGGLVSVPIVAVPTSVGYGASFNGLAALLAMLNSCATGVAVVNIDNGFGAGTLAARINRLAACGGSA
ncbi:MAG: nickel pincer cofactor biosynthesis protein LarB [Chloroflexi bacterium]|nr:nickel pincer cofactor biosynthesis protein LarB [Chloroflexota bacterium]